MQSYLVQQATVYFSNKFGTKVQIASVDFQLFNKVLLQDVYIEDQRGDSLLYIHKLKMGFSPLALFRNKFVCNQLELNKFSGNLVLDKKKVLNITFILNALKSDKKTESKLVYRIENIRITDSKFTYTNENATPKGKCFDPNYLRLKDLNASLSLHKLSSKYLSVDINALSFSDKSGFQLHNLKTSLKANKSKAFVKNISVELPNSQISFSSVSFAYDSLANLKHFAEKVRFGFKLRPSEIDLADLKAFVPAFARTKGKVKVSTRFSGSVANMKINNLSLSYANAISLRGNFELSGLPNLNETFVYANFKEVETSKTKLQDLVSNLIGRPFQLPEQLNQLGAIHYKGNVSGFFSNLVAYGTLNTDIGQLSTDVLMEIQPDFKGLDYSGSLRTKQLKLAKLLGEKSLLGDISFNLSSKGSVRAKGEFKGTIDGNIESVLFKQYTYKNITLKGAFGKKGFDGQVDLDDPNAKLNFNGTINLSEHLPSGKFRMSVKRLNLYKLNLIKDHPDLTLAFNVNTNFIGSKIEATDTQILIDSIYIANKQKELFLNKIDISSDINDSSSVLKINSDLINGVVKGQYSFLSLSQNLVKIVTNYLPSLKKDNLKKGQGSSNNFVFYFTDFNVNELADVMDVNLTLSSKTLISGFFNDKLGKFRLEVLVPQLQFGKSSFTDIYLLCNNPTNAIELISSGDINQKMKVNIDSRIANDSLQLNFDWRNPKVFSGRFSTLGVLGKDTEQKLKADIEILPSQIWVKDTLWNVNQSKLTTDFKKLTVSNFGLEHEDQFVKIDGVASNQITDSLSIKLKKIRLDYVMFLIDLRSPKMDALVDGDCVALSVFNKMVLKLDLFAKDFTFNNALWGDVKMKSDWDDSRKMLVAKGYAYSKKDTAFFINGEYYRKNDSLDFYVDARRLELNFLRYYLDQTLQRVSGVVNGKARIFGSLKHILFDGDLAVKDGRFDVDYLKTSYHFSDTIHVREDGLFFKNITLYDDENHSGLLNGQLTHKYFKDMKFRFDVNCKNMLAMNTTQKDNEAFYGKAYGTGTVRIQGNANKVAFNINMKTEPNSKVMIPMTGSAIATENSFIQYVSKPKIKSGGIILKNNAISPVAESTKANIHVFLQLEATPDVEVLLITDPIGGDMVRAVGSGNLRIDFDTSDKLKMYGNYEVEKGDYIFTLQQVVRKNFAIKRGGTIRWAGNPYQAIIDLDATYTVPSVSLLDILDEAQLESASRTSMPVNCLLNLTGDLMQPTIKFDLELPSDPELQRRIKNIVNTDEMMNREILALLVMSRFYKPDYLQNSKTGLGTEMASVLTTTVSGQLNSWLSKISNKVNLGLNARLGNGENFTDGGEYELAFMYQPNHRLLINSNVGYRNDVLSTSTSNFIGDVDVEYKLNKSGKLRAKAYTHSADNYFLNASTTAKTTQGVGLLYREDFNTFSDILKYYFNKKSKKRDTIQTINKDTVPVKK